MADIRKMSNGEVWRKWREALEDWATSPEIRYKADRLEVFENEIIRRLHNASQLSVQGVRIGIRGAGNSSVSPPG